MWVICVRLLSYVTNIISEAYMYKHLSIVQRVLIEDRLNKKVSFRSIAKELGVSPSTIQREIKRHTKIVKTNRNDCKYNRDCIHRHLCNKPECNDLCAYCFTTKCGRFCKDYEKQICPLLEDKNFLCNYCSKRGVCRFERRIYLAKEAESEYQYTLVSSRAGFDVTDSELEQINQLASPLIQNGLSPYHVKQTYGDKLPVSESTLRRMIDRCELDARNIDLRDKVKRNPRSTTLNKSRIKNISVSKIGRLYEDYLAYIETNDVFTVEMDCVEGAKTDSATLLTLTWKSLSLQLALILNEHTSDAVVEALDILELSLGLDLFQEMFPLILTDNGHEFYDIEGMELSKTGTKRTNIFFCEANRSDQKGTCENHHKMIRYCIPKGTSLEPYSQEEISTMMNHINSYKRKALFGRSAYELAKEVLPTDFFTLLGLEEIPPNEIVLTPQLFCHSKCNS